MSYLLFASKYTTDLIEIGYHDASERIDEIEDFLFSPDDDADEEIAVGPPGANKSRSNSTSSKRNLN